MVAGNRDSSRGGAGREEQPESPKGAPSGPRKGGGLVSRRVEMYEAPFTGGKKGYFHRQQDSFHTIPQEQLVEESRDEVSTPPPTPTPPTPAAAEQSLPEPAPDAPAPEVTAKVKVPKSFAGCSLVESGVDHYKKGEYEKAHKAFTAALKTQRAGAEEDDMCVALTLSNLGAVYLQQNKLDEAEAVLYESLEMKKRISPNMILTDTLNNLGNCANLRGDYATSLVFYEEALDDIRAKKGRRSDEADALFNIGRLNIQQHSWEKAMSALNEACRLARELYGTNHLFVAQCLDLMGFIQLSTAKLESSMVSFTGALAIYRRLYGPMHLEVANSLFNVGMVREAKGDLTDAWEAYTTARDLYYRLGTDHEHPGFATVRQSIVNIEKSIAKQKKQRVVKTQHQQGVSETSPPRKSHVL